MIRSFFMPASRLNVLAQRVWSSSGSKHRQTANAARLLRDALSFAGGRHRQRPGRQRKTVEQSQLVAMLS